MIGRPGSIPWLLGHEIRMSYRSAMARRGRSNRLAVRWVLAAVALAGLTTGGVAIAFAVRGITIAPTPLAVVVADLALAMVFTLMLSQTLFAAIETLYERGDLDLMFSSPIPPRTVMTVRLLIVAAGLFGAFGFLAAPLILPSVFMGHPEWLAAIPMLAALALAASALGVALAMALFAVIGPRRTRAVAQVTAALVGASFFLLSQIRHPGAGRARGIWSDAIAMGSAEGFRPPPLADLPLRALLGEPGPLAILLAAAAMLFVGVNIWLGGRFAADAAAAKGAGAAPAKGRAAASFAGGIWAATMAKEVRLLTRDAALIAQVLLRVLYMLPLAYVLLRNAGTRSEHLLPGGAAALAFMAGQVAGSLTWITVSAEDAPDLLAAAPVAPGVLNQAKLAAALAPVAVLLVIPLAALVVMAPATGLVATAGCVAATLSSGLINIWHQQPGKRSDFRRRRGAAWYVTLMDAMALSLIAATVYLAARGLLWAILPALAAIGLLAVLRRSDAQIADALRGAR